MALGINAIAAIAGSFIGLMLGGLLGPINWHFVFWSRSPIGAFGTVWAYLMLRDIGTRVPARMRLVRQHLVRGRADRNPGRHDLRPAALRRPPHGLDQPVGAHRDLRRAGGAGGVRLRGDQVAQPLFRLSLFRIRAFAAGNIANFMLALGRGGMQFMLIIWLQGIWLPLHGYSFSQTPLWAGIYLVPLTIGFLVSAPLSGVLSDRYGAKAFTVGGALLTALSFFLLLFLPVNFPYLVFALIIVLNGFGSGLFASPNRAEMMNSCRRTSVARPAA